MSQSIVIDPITRIEGHLRIDVEVDQGKCRRPGPLDRCCAASSASCSAAIRARPGSSRSASAASAPPCTRWPRCARSKTRSTCQIPINAQYIRNLILIAHALHDHIVHFYHLSALDWVDVTQVLKADPAKASSIAESLSDWPSNSAKEMAAVKTKVKGLVDSGQLGPFAHGYWGHPAMKLPPEVNLIAVAHYLQALEYQRYANQVVACSAARRRTSRTSPSAACRTPSTSTARRRSTSTGCTR